MITPGVPAGMVVLFPLGIWIASKSRLQGEFGIFVHGATATSLEILRLVKTTGGGCLSEASDFRRDARSDKSDASERRSPYPGSRTIFDLHFGCLTRVKLAQQGWSALLLCFSRASSTPPSLDSAERRAPSTNCAQWILTGGNAPKGAANSSPDMD